MARNRMIKSEFWSSEQVLNCSLEARLLFIGLWNFADDNGIYPASYIKLKAQVLPNDNSKEDVISWINELIGNKLLLEYTVDNNKYWIVTGWNKHQKIDKPTYRYPKPILDTNGKLDTTQLPIDEYSPTIPREIDDTATTYGQSVDPKEKKNKENKRNNTYGENLSSERVNQTQIIRHVFHHWQKKMHHPKSKLDSKRKNVIKRALNLGYSPDELKRAIDGCANTPYNMGQNQQGQIYDGICLILRDSEHIERFINNGAVNKHMILTGASSNDFMQGAI